MTAEQPDRRALLAAATEGPWHATTCTHEDDQWSHSVVSSPMGQLADTSKSLVGEGDDAELIAAMRNQLPGILDRLDALTAAVDRVRRRHPRGDEESGYLAPGLWCPTCGHERTDNGYGGCPDRDALIIPGEPLRTRDALDGAQ